jgi:isopenicillin N synthase-like dioxygenase
MNSMTEKTQPIGKTSHSESPQASQAQSNPTQQKKAARKVPELSLNSFIEGGATERARFVDNFFIGLKDYGFIVLKDHPVETQLINRAYELMAKLFALPVEQKKNYALFDHGFQRGYTPFGTEHAKNNPISDLKEFWHVGREMTKGHRFEKYYFENVWPSEIKEFREVFSKIYKALDNTGMIMLEALAAPLDVPHGFLSSMVNDGNSILRLLHYPPIPVGADPRSIRAAAHEDINFITILVSATTSGLQLKDRDGTWLDVDSDPNSLIVDAGDMLARLTNDVIPSTTHRVVNPIDSSSSRYSMPFFMHPNPDALLSCLPSCLGSGAKYEDITAQDFLMQRLREIGLMK